ncbi:hypothetical protein P7K49_037897, partial [Saguinus oedipus]
MASSLPLGPRLPLRRLPCGLAICAFALPVFYRTLVARSQCGPRCSDSPTARQRVPAAFRA